MFPVFSRSRITFLPFCKNLYFSVTICFKGLSEIKSNSPNILKNKNVVLFNDRKYSDIKQAEELKYVRNIGIIAHIDAGKTTTTERMLYYSGFAPVMGEVHDGDTVMDYMIQERERGITITSAAITFNWQKHKINLIDTPGHVDFTVEVERSLRVLDGAIAILDASAGVEAQTLTVWNQANKYVLPRIIYLNKMDKVSANLDLCMKSIENKLKVKPLLLHYPLGEGKEFRGVIDIVSMEKAVWKRQNVLKDDGKIFVKKPLDCAENKDLWDKVSKQREALIETVADLDDDVAAKIISAETSACLSVNEICAALRRIALKQYAVPVFCGSSYNNIGVQLLMDAVINYLPNPLERPHDFVKFYMGELCALVFKIIHDKQKGVLVFIRIYSGSIEHGQKLYNATKRITEKITKLMIAFADEFQDVNKVSCGSIAVVTGLKHAVTGDLFVSSSTAENKARKAYAIANNINEDDVSSVVTGIEVPEPVYLCSIEPPSLAFEKQLDFALQCLQREDPTFKVEVSEDSGQTVISGMGVLHIEVMKDRIYREYGVDAFLGELQVAYKEMPQKDCVQTLVLEKNLSGTKHFVKITLSVHQNHECGKFRAVKVVVTKENELGKIRQDYLKAINKGIESAFNYGPLLGFNVINANVKLLWLEVGHHTSLPMITAAAVQCIQSAMKKENVYLLEPVMKLQITVGSSYLGRILADLSQRRSEIIEIQPRDDVHIVINKTPLSELRNYSTDLRTLASGNATFTMEFDCYQKMLPHDEAKAIEQVTGFAPM